MTGPLLRRHMKSRVAWHEGHEPTDRERTVNLPPGETVVVARTAFQLLKEPENRADIAKLPRVDAFLVKDAARYSFRTRMLVRGSAAASLKLSTGRTRLWVGDENAPPVKPASATDGRGKVTLSYDMPGAAPQAEIVIRSLPESGLLLSKIPVSIELANGGEPRTIEWAAGRYEVFRRVKLTVGSWTMDVPCDRRIVTVTAGKTEEVKFTRSREDAAVAKGQWPDLASHGVAGAFLTVHPIADKILNAGDPDAYFDFEIDRETLIATTCGPDGKFTLEPLPVGRYVVVLRAFREPAANNGGPSLPYLVGVNTFNVLSENRGVYFYPNDFRVRPRWNTPTWSPTRVAAGDAADRPKNGAAAFGQVPVDSTANSAGNTLSSGLFPGRFGGVSQNMRIDADGGISYGDAKNPCQMTLFNDDRLQIGFLNERQIWTDVTLPLTTGAGGQQRAVWSAEVDGYAYQATAIPAAACGCVFRLEKRLDGKLVHGSLQFFAVKSRQAGAEQDKPAAPIDYRDWRVDQSRTGVVAGSYTGRAGRCGSPPTGPFRTAINRPASAI